MYAYVESVPVNVSSHCAVTDDREGFCLFSWFYFVLLVSWEVGLVDKISWCVHMRT